MKIKLENLPPLDTDEIEQFAKAIAMLTEKKSISELQKIYDLIVKQKELTRSEAIAASEVKRALVSLQKPLKPLNPLLVLPMHKWWHLFIDKKYQKSEKSDHDNALCFDLDDSPGFFHAMMSLFEEVLLPIQPGTITIITFKDYYILHEKVTKKAMAKGTDSYLQIAEGWSDRTTTFAMTDLSVPPSLEAIEEMVKEKLLACNKFDLPNLLKGEFPKGAHEEDKQVLKLIATLTDKAGGPASFTAVLTFIGESRKYEAQPNYTQEQAPQKVQQILDEYYQEQEKIRKQRKLGKTIVVGELTEADQKSLLVIVKCIRALHVGHFFPDANGRLNIMLLLNKFLLEECFSPVILNDPAVFGGGKSLKQLLEEVLTGMSTFLQVVKTETTSL